MDVRLDDRSGRAVPRSGVGVQLVEASPVKTTEYRGIVVKTWLGSNGTYWWAVYDEIDVTPFCTGDGLAREDDALIAARRQVSIHLGDFS